MKQVFILLLYILLSACGDKTGHYNSSYNVDSYLKKKYDIDHVNIYAKYGILDSSNTLHSKEYFQTVNNGKHFNEYIKKLSKVTPQVIKQKSKVKAAKLNSILKKIQNQFNLKHQDFAVYLNNNNLIKLDNVAKHVPLFKPVINSVITSSFGMRHHPLKRKKCMHKGIDMVGPKKGQIYAAAEGIVEKAEFSKSYGNYILIKHKYNLKTRYAHLSKINVKEGDYILLAEYIGNQGATGATKKEHLHFEVLFNNKCINPWGFIQYN